MVNIVKENKKLRNKIDRLEKNNKLLEKLNKTLNKVIKGKYLTRKDLGV